MESEQEVLFLLFLVKKKKKTQNKKYIYINNVQSLKIKIKCIPRNRILSIPQKPPVYSSLSFFLPTHKVTTTLNIITNFLAFFFYS